MSLGTDPLLEEEPPKVGRGVISVFLGASVLVGFGFVWLLMKLLEKTR